MVDNLTIQAGLDARDLTAGLILAREDLRKFAIEARQAAKAGDTGAVQNIAGDIVGAEARIKGFRDALATAHPEARTLAGRVRELGDSLEQMRGQFRGGLEGLLGNTPITAKGLGIGVAIAGIGEFFRLIGETAERAHQMEAFSEELGISTGQTREWANSAGHAGANAEVMEKSLIRLSSAAEKAAEGQRKLAIEGAKVLVEHGGLGVVAQGKVEAPTAKLVEPRLVPSLDQLKNMQAVRQEMIKLNEAVFLRRQAGAADPFVTLDQVAFKIRAELIAGGKAADQLWEKINKGGGFIPPKDLTQALTMGEPGFRDPFAARNIPVLDDHTGKSLGMDQVFAKAAIAMAGMEGGALTKFARETMGRGGTDPLSLAFLRQQGEQGGGIFNTPAFKDKDISTLAELQAQLNAMKATTDDWRISLAANLVRALQGGTEEARNLGGALNDIGNEPGVTNEVQRLDTLGETLRGLAATARDAASWIGAVFGAGGGANGTASTDALAQTSGFASGGLIYGPGTGTSDSIVARVSHGEYIVSAAATQRLGTGFLDRVNFGRYVPRFASGGAVSGTSSGGGAGLGTVNIVLQDGSKHGPMQAEQNVFEHLVQHLRTKQRVQIGPRASTATATP